jgi:hypothetical protein
MSAPRSGGDFPGFPEPPVLAAALYEALGLP